MAKNTDINKILAETQALLNKSKGVTQQPPPPKQDKQTGSRFAGLMNLFVKVDAPTNPEEVEHVAHEEVGVTVPEFEAPAETDGLESKPFEQIYAEAGLAPSECSIDDLEQLIKDPKIATQPMAIKAQFVDFALQAKNVDIQVPITNAVERDAALDGYHAMLTRRASEIRTNNEQAIGNLTAEVEAFIQQKQQEMDALRAETAEADRQAQAFAERRRAEEKRLFDLVAPFVTGDNPITVGNTPSVEAVT